MKPHPRPHLHSDASLPPPEAYRSRSPRVSGPAAGGIELKPAKWIGSRPRIIKARIGLPQGQVLPALNLPALEIAVKGRAQRGGTGDVTNPRHETGSGVTTASDGRHVIQAYKGPTRTPHKKKADAAPREEYRAWTPNEVDGVANVRRRSLSPSRTPRRKPAGSGSITDRGTDESRRGRNGPRDRCMAPVTPYVDLVHRQGNLDIDGRVRFPTRGGVRKMGSSNKMEIDPVEFFYIDQLKKYPLDTKIRRDFASWLHERGRLKESEKQLRAALTQEPFEPHTLNRFAMLLWDQKKYSKSQDVLKRALRADPSCLAVLLNAAIASLSLGKSHSALQYFSRVLDHDRDLPIALLGCAVAMEDLGDANLDEIESIYMRVLRKDPSNFDALFSLGRFYKARCRNWSKSEQYYLEALEVRPQDTSALCSYGALLSEQTQTNPHILKQAADCFQQVLALEPSHFEATYNYAVLLGKWERTLSTEVDLAQCEVQHPSKCPVVHVHLYQNQAEIRESHHELPLDAISTSANRQLLAIQLYRKVVRSVCAACEVILVRVNLMI